MRFYPLVGLRLEPVENFQTVSEEEFSETREHEKEPGYSYPSSTLTLCPLLVVN